jgi:hypothetical protein
MLISLFGSCAAPPTAHRRAALHRCRNRPIEIYSRKPANAFCCRRTAVTDLRAPVRATWHGAASLSKDWQLGRSAIELPFRWACGLFREPAENSGGICRRDRHVNEDRTNARHVLGLSQSFQEPPERKRQLQSKAQSHLPARQIAWRLVQLAVEMSAQWPRSPTQQGP